jgi:hypothetical protein
MFTLKDFKVGQRVQLHPFTNLWMRGARYGEVVKIGTRVLQVKLDANGRTVSLAPVYIGEIL